jgi:hypothetical protein
VEPLPQFKDGLVAYVKRACPTCTLIEPQLQEIAQARPSFHVVTQDDPQFPRRVTRVIDDRELDHSYVAGIEATPTLIRYEGGREAERVVGWDREAWRRLTGLHTLGKDLPAMRPG